MRPPTTSSDTRSVVESDIWKIDGDTMYFFNQNRGLQVIDVSNPDLPVLTGTYDLPLPAKICMCLGTIRSRCSRKIIVVGTATRRGAT